jgi:YihY family inner membrane protein
VILGEIKPMRRLSQKLDEAAKITRLLTTGKYPQALSSTPSPLVLMVENYFKIGGSEGAAAFAYYAFFSLFPLVMMAVMVASFFADRDRAVREVIGYLKEYAPLNAQMSQGLFGVIDGVVDASPGVRAAVPLIFFWGAFRFFNVLIRAVNRAWGTQTKNWWRLPLKNFFLLGITGVTILLGLAVPVAARVAKKWLFSTGDFIPWMYDAVMVIFPLLVLFLGLSLLYRLAPCRPTRFAEVWNAALAAAALLCILESLFVVYLRTFAQLNLLYGAFGGMMSFLLWIYLSGCIIILGACLCAAQAEAKAHWWDKIHPDS